MNNKSSYQVFSGICIILIFILPLLAGFIYVREIQRRSLLTLPPSSVPQIDIKRYDAIVLAMKERSFVGASPSANITPGKGRKDPFRP